MFRHTLNLGMKRKLIHARLPWWYFLAPGVVALKYDGFQRTMRFRGPDVASMEDSALIGQMERLNDALRRLRGQYAIHIEAQRIHTDAYPGDDLSEEERREVWPDPVSWMMDEERREYFKAGEHFENIQYITFVYKCRGKAAQNATNIMIKQAEPEPVASYRDELGEFLRQTEGVRVLLAELTQEAESECRWLTDAETLEFLHNTVSTKRQKIAPSMGRYRVDHEVADCRVVGGTHPKLGDCHLRTVTLTNVPETAPAILDSLNDLGFEYRWSVRWLPFDYGEGLKVIQDKKADWGMFALPFKHFVAQYMHAEAGDENATSDSMTDDAADALDAAKDEALAIGKLQVSITVWHPDKKTINKRVAQIIEVCEKRGMVAKRLGVAALDTWLGTLPGHIYADTRAPIRTSVNLSHLIPWAAAWGGATGSPYLKEKTGYGGPLAMVDSDRNTPFRFNMHHGDTSALVALGPPGAGKSTLLNFLRGQYRRVPGAKIISIDIGRSAEVCTRLMGGVMYDVGKIGGIGFQPLARIHDPDWRAWANEWVLGLLVKQKVEITAKVKADVSVALADVARNPVEDRTLTELSVALPDYLKSAINHFCIDGDYKNLLDDDRERIGESNCVTFEMGDLIGKTEVIGPVLEYLFQYLEKVVFDGISPVLLLIDEAWRFLNNPLFVERFDSWLRLLRKRNVAPVFATQFLRDAMEGPLAAALRESAPNWIYGANAKAVEPKTQAQYMQAGVNAVETQIIARMTPKRHYYFSSPAGKRTFELSLGPIGMELCGSSYGDALMRCDRLAAHGGPESFAELWFRGRIDWASELVANDQFRHSESRINYAMVAE